VCDAAPSRRLAIHTSAGSSRKRPERIGGFPAAAHVLTGRRRLQAARPAACPQDQIGGWREIDGQRLRRASEITDSPIHQFTK
jgi:hypothetical protein